MIWHNSSIQEVLSELNTDKEKGLYNEAASMRLAQYGKNELRDFEKKGYFYYLTKELRSFFVILLAVVALIYIVVTLATKESGWLDAVIVIAAMLTSCSINAFSKYKTNKTLYGISRQTGSYVSVIRNGEETVIPSRELVPGDIMLLKTGDYVKADGRLIDSYALTCDEFKLSGISVPTEKAHDIQFDDITPISSRSNMVYCGSTVVNGKGVAVVTETAYSTEFGKTKKIKNQTEDVSTPLSEKLSKIGKAFSTSAIVASVLVFIFGIIFNFSSSDISFAKTVISQLLLSVSICFIALPEGISSLLDIALSCSAGRLKAKDVTVKNLQIIEKLKDITVICTDKTGVITTGDMCVEKICTERGEIEADDDSINEVGATILKLALICSNFKHDEHTERHTNNMERAIEEACIKYLGMSKADIDGIYPALAEIPFDSQRMLMTTVSAINGSPYAIVKGAPEVIAQRCLNASAEDINKMSDELADSGLKVIAVAMNPLSEIPANPNSEELERDLTFIGLIGFKDKIDLDAYNLCNECISSGIKIVMITGDHLNTARQTALKLGIIDDENMAISGDELAKIDDAELADKIDNYGVFARVSPEDKLRIVNALKSRFENVAVTGDTASDATAVSAADVGCALGLAASDVIKDSSDIILEKNRISSLITSLKESAYMLFALKSSSYYLISDVAIKLFVLIFGLFIFGVFPLSASGFMLLTVITSILPKFAFFTESNATEDVLESSNMSFFNKASCIKMTAVSVLITIMALIGYGIGLSYGINTAEATAFAVIAICELVYAFSLSLKRSVFKGFVLSKKSMPLAVLICLIITIIIIATPMASFSLFSIIFMFICAVAVFVTSELLKNFLPKLLK